MSSSAILSLEWLVAAGFCVWSVRLAWTSADWRFALFGVSALVVAGRDVFNFPVDTASVFFVAVAYTLVVWQIETLRQVSTKLHKSEERVDRMNSELRECLNSSSSVLKSSEARLHSLSQVLPVSIFRTDGDGECVYVNSRWVELTGRGKTQSYGRGWLESIHPEDR
ncbi:MAG: PAS domain-containing protein, partial [Planctomycetia bacterium]